MDSPFSFQLQRIVHANKIPNKANFWSNKLIGFDFVILVQLASSGFTRCIVTSPLKRKDKADTLVAIIELSAVGQLQGCSLPSGKDTKTNLLSVKSRGLVIEWAAFPLDP